MSKIDFPVISGINLIATILDEKLEVQADRVIGEFCYNYYTCPQHYP